MAAKISGPASKYSLKNDRHNALPFILYRPAAAPTGTV
jgi:hypothetical protein